MYPEAVSYIELREIDFKGNKILFFSFSALTLFLLKTIQRRQIFHTFKLKLMEKISPKVEIESVMFKVGLKLYIH